MVPNVPWSRVAQKSVVRSPPALLRLTVAAFISIRPPPLFPLASIAPLHGNDIAPALPILNSALPTVFTLIPLESNTILEHPEQPCNDKDPPPWTAGVFTCVNAVICPLVVMVTPVPLPTVIFDPSSEIIESVI